MAATRFDHARLGPLSLGHERLMVLLCQRVTDGMLDEIAACDYGMDQVKHRAALERIRARDIPSGRMAWEPKEVLELFRWSEFGDDRSNRRPRSEAQFHLMRAFCCVALLEAYAVPENHETMQGANATMAQLLESLAFVGEDAQSVAPAFLAWLLTELPSFEDERAFFIVALVWALDRAGTAAAHHVLVSDLIAWAIDEEAAVRETWRGGVGKHPHRWLIGTTHFDLRWRKWETIGRLLGDRAADVENPELRAKLADLAKRLTVDQA